LVCWLSDSGICILNSTDSYRLSCSFGNTGLALPPLDTLTAGETVKLESLMPQVRLQVWSSFGKRTGVHPGLTNQLLLAEVLDYR
jgi:hypothetical protein